MYASSEGLLLCSWSYACCEQSPTNHDTWLSWLGSILYNHQNLTIASYTIHISKLYSSTCTARPTLWYKMDSILGSEIDQSTIYPPLSVTATLFSFPTTDHILSKLTHPLRLHSCLALGNLTMLEHRPTTSRPWTIIFSHPALSLWMPHLPLFFADSGYVFKINLSLNGRKQK